MVESLTLSGNPIALAMAVDTKLSLRSAPGLRMESADDKYYIRSTVFRPQTMEIKDGEDLVECFASFARRRRCGISVLSGEGSVNSANLLQPGHAGEVFEIRGRFDILSLSGKFFPPPTPSRLSLLVGGKDGKVIGGIVAGSLFTAGSVAVTFSTIAHNGLPQQSKESTGEGKAVESELSPLRGRFDFHFDPLFPPSSSQGDKCTTEGNEIEILSPSFAFKNYFLSEVDSPSFVASNCLQSKESTGEGKTVENSLSQNRPEFDEHDDFILPIIPDLNFLYEFDSVVKLKPVNGIHPLRVTGIAILFIVRAKKYVKRSISPDQLLTTSSWDKTFGDLKQSLLINQLNYNEKFLPFKTELSKLLVSNLSDTLRENLISKVSIIHGRQNDTVQLVNLLLSSECRQHYVSVVSIAGAEGTGKTTLAHLVYNLPEVWRSFSTQIWISMCHINNLKGVYQAITESLTGISCSLCELAELREIVKDELRGKRFLIVLDSYKNDTQLLQSELFSDFNVGAPGSIVLMTIRTELTADATFIIKNYNLSRLSDNDCRSIIHNHAFSDAVPSLFADMQDLLVEIMVPLCKANPSVARALGGTLYSITTAGERGKIFLRNELGLLSQRDDILMKTLTTNYYLLPESLQNCLLYCSLFPRGHIVKRNEIICLWMSQGFLDCKDGKSEQDIGDDYYYELFSRSFLQLPIASKEKNGYFQLHDLAYDFVLSVSGEKFYRINDTNSCTLSDEVCHISSNPFMSNNLKDFDTVKNCHSLHSLLLINTSEYWTGNRIQIANTDVLEDLFQNLLLLKALDLSFTTITELPKSIENLKNLRYLGLSFSNIRRLPDSICSIGNLQTLKLQDCAYLHELPDDTKHLTNLTNLDIRKRSGFVGIPKGIAQLTGLRYLSAFLVGEDEWHCGIAELQNLENLVGDLCLGGLQYISSEEDAKSADLQNKKGLTSLTMQWSSSGTDIENNEVNCKVDDIFENLQPHSKIEELTVRDYPGRRFPLWFENPFSKLISIAFDNCPWCIALPPLGQLKSLKHLSMQRMNAIQTVGKEFRGSNNVSSHAFPSLETFNLWEMYNMKEWHGFESSDFLNLHTLSVSKCYKLINLPSFSSLTKLSIHYCAEMPYLGDLLSIKSLSIKGLQKECIYLQKSLCKLQYLEVKSCNMLLGLTGLKHLEALQMLVVAKCPKLQLVSDEFASELGHMDIHRSCSLLYAWCPPGFKEAKVDQDWRRLIKDQESANNEAVKMDID